MLDLGVTMHSKKMSHQDTNSKPHTMFQFNLKSAHVTLSLMSFKNSLRDVHATTCVFTYTSHAVLWD